VTRQLQRKKNSRDDLELIWYYEKNVAIEKIFRGAAGSLC